MYTAGKELWKMAATKHTDLGMYKHYGSVVLYKKLLMEFNMMDLVLVYKYGNEWWYQLILIDEFFYVSLLICVNN